MLPGKSEIISISNANQSVYNSIRRFAMDGLNDLIRVLMESVDDALFELSDKVENDRERNLYFEAMREIRIKRDSLQQNFDLELRRRFDTLINPQPEQNVFDDSDELTLVELEEIEDSIAIDNMIKKARPNFEDDLFAVGERLRTLLRRKEISPDDNPLDPKSICDSFHSASDVLDTEIQVRLIFYKLFDRYVVNNLGHFYRELNSLFVQKGVLPEFHAEQERMRHTTRFMANRIRANPAPSDGPTSTPAGNGDSSHGTNGGGSPAYAPVGNGGLYASLQQALGGAVSGGGVAGDVFEPTGGLVPEAAPGAFVAALSGLQLAGVATQPLAAIDPQQLRSETRQQIQLFRQQNQQQVAAADNQTIDVVSMLFDFFFDDDALPPPIKVLIGRLQIPILKLAILDKDFFNQKKHPARRLLDGLSRAALGWGENAAEEQALLNKAEEIVNFLVSEFEDDVAVFEQALGQLDSFLQREREVRDQAEQALRQQEEQRDQRIQQARDATSAQIEKLTRGQDLSFDVVDFLDTTWSSVLFNAYLAMGSESNHWKNLTRIGATLVWTLQPKHSEAERNKILKTIPSMLRALTRGMDLVKIKTEVQNRIFQMLAQQHALVVKLTARNIAAGGIDQATSGRPAGTVERPIRSRPEAPKQPVATRAETDRTSPTEAKSRPEPAATASPPNAAVEAKPDAAASGDASAQIVPAADQSPPSPAAKSAQPAAAAEPLLPVTEKKLSASAKAEQTRSDEPLVEVDLAPTNQVIENLEQFTSGVNSGEITFEEEIVLVDESGQDLELARVDDWTDQAAAIEIGDWVEFNESSSRVMMARLSWKSQVSGSLVFVNRKGQRVRGMSVSDLAAELRDGKACRVEASSVFDRAVYSIMNKMAG